MKGLIARKRERIAADQLEARLNSQEETGQKIGKIIADEIKENIDKYEGFSLIRAKNGDGYSVEAAKVDSTSINRLFCGKNGFNLAFATIKGNDISVVKGGGYGPYGAQEFSDPKDAANYMLRSINEFYEN